MTRKYISIAGLSDIPDLIQSRSFWEGVAMGLSPQRYLCDFGASYKLHDSAQSAYDSWLEVGELLADAANEFGHEQASEQTAPASEQPIKQRAIAG
jgi:hypothetical protein